MNRVYVVWCRKCGKYLVDKPVSAKNLDEAWDKLQDYVKGHDIAMHPDGEWFDVEVVRFVPHGERRARKEPKR